MRDYLTAHPDQSLAQIASHFDVKKLTISNRLKLIGLSKSQNTSKFKDKLLQDYIAAHPDQTLAQIGGHFNVTKQAISFRLKQMGITHQRDRIVKVEAKDLQDYVASHPDQTLVQIGRHFSVTGNFIASRLRQLGITRDVKRLKIEDNVLREYINAHPDQTLAQIGKHFDVSDVTILNRSKKIGLTFIKRKEKSKIEATALKDYITAHPNQTFKQIGKHFGVSGVAIYVRLKKIGFAYKGKTKGIKIEADALKNYIKENPHQTLRQIAKHFNISKTTLEKRLREIGFSKGRSVR